MKTRLLTTLGMAAVMTGLAGCVAAPPRAQYYDRDPGYRDAPRQCQRCGVVENVDRVYLRNGSTGGGGAVLGAIIGGVLGSTVGKGDGRTAATVAGAVAGGFAGNAVESHNGGGTPAWRFDVRLDDGQYASVTQYENDDLRPGDRVVIRRDHVFHL